ncbi:MAG: tRNA (guanosine(37)-N1)-methyltransferase TrmD [Candidatus Pacebacteria bacterium]|nr:tRNA (guanosine(37)-N1)-methyltransferase TrmD [Parcubacteria group bacterium]MDP6249351.1 tRNA (guanosine(37)-N1)-methyltransferase TrmD [Candidatus Paceibacterota bacterium]MDP7159436.1 tRNA (guanosine(37)-N1)-methyltransferase TrmD [Candidatus Paceibacterota bacterium]MDP7366736.1 tRNA (guanosine(37)-N1)-methyltransferase TrmD [Candidatus Paceibacterota bacterium]MDP7466511.1 tRNA (guanosine(37)-N1)-methyltransferase TrmD [Candidatus Paceibacterota bacterium]|tara:strand:- start:4520 stop:5194 length:675 start_codon:yes stop_codon:yes gene_type:complete
MNFHIITLLPYAFDSYINESIVARAVKERKIKIKFYNPRDFTKDPERKSKIFHGAGKHNRRVDKSPYGGGPGMVIEALPVLKAVEKAVGKKKKVKIIFLAPNGKQFDNTYAKKLSKTYKDIVIIAGRYEGVDARVRKILKAEVVTVGPYVLTGGELPAMIILDAVARQIKGVLGNKDSIEEGRTASKDVYTRPEVLEYKDKKHRVPKVLLSGHHEKINKWREKK